MKFKKLNSRYETNVNINKFLIDWSKVVSKPQKAVKDFLYEYWKYDQVLEEFVIPGSRLRIDLLNLTQKIAVEVSPESSHSFNPFFHKTRVGGFLASVKRDLDKENWIKQNEFIYIDLNSEDIKNISEEIFKKQGLIL